MYCGIWRFASHHNRCVLISKIKRLEYQIEEERSKMIKVTKDVRIQTDPDLASENRDIAIQHAKFKMAQALKERDRALKENVRMEKENERFAADAFIF